jgi:hypothetical protein
VGLELSFVDRRGGVSESFPKTRITKPNSFPSYHLGLVVDGDANNEALIFKQVGKVAALRKKIEESPNLDTQKTFVSHGGMAHTRW